MCGDCNAKVPLKRGDPIRCKECGHRVLYKERTKRLVYMMTRGPKKSADCCGCPEWCSLRRDRGRMATIREEVIGME
jgi:DNA-directed RNA polymerase subunit RPC12/RpoP